jgi:hypothetical protein
MTSKADEQDGSPPPHESSPFGGFEQEPVLQRATGPFPSEATSRSRRRRLRLNPAVVAAALALIVAVPLVAAGIQAGSDDGGGAASPATTSTQAEQLDSEGAFDDCAQNGVSPTRCSLLAKSRSASLTYVRCRRNEFTAAVCLSEAESRERLENP